MGKMKEQWEAQRTQGMEEAYDKSHLMSPQFNGMTSEDMNQMAEDLAKPSKTSQKSAKRGTFMPKNAKAPF